MKIEDSDPPTVLTDTGHSNQSNQVILCGPPTSLSMMKRAYTLPVFM